MVKLTKRMHEVLKNADLERGEINDVPMNTMYGLEARQLVSSNWRKAGNHARQTTTGGAFPKHSQVKLTAAGLRAAHAIQGLRPNL